MSEVCSVGLEDLNSDSQEKDLKQSGSLRITNTAKQSSEKTFQTSLFTKTSEKLTSENLNELKSLQADSHAKTSHVPTLKEKELKENGVGCGHITQKLLGKYNPNTQSLKTPQCSLTEDSKLSLETLPKTGMMRNGSVYELQISERYTEENDCLLLPTLIGTEVEKMPTGSMYRLLKFGEKYTPNDHRRLSPFLLPTLTINGNHNYQGASKTSGDGLRVFQRNTSGGLEWM